MKKQGVSMSQVTDKVTSQYDTTPQGLGKGDQCKKLCKAGQG